MPIYQSPIGVSVTTNLVTGIGNVAVKVPGTFSGFPPVDPAQARYLSYVEFSADTITVGDYVDAISIEDTDGVIPVPARGAFPSYPTIIDFSADSGATGVTIGGYYFDKNTGYVKISTFDGLPQLIPSGLYIKATIHGGLDKVYRVNIVWGRAA